MRGTVERFFVPSRISQFLFLALFLFLFIITDYRGKDEISIGVNSFFRTDPLVLASYVLAVKSFTWLLLPALLMTGIYRIAWKVLLRLDLSVRNAYGPGYTEDRKIGPDTVLEGKVSILPSFYASRHCFILCQPVGSFRPDRAIGQGPDILLLPLRGPCRTLGLVGTLHDRRGQP